MKITFDQAEEILEEEKEIGKWSRILSDIMGDEPITVPTDSPKYLELYRVYEGIRIGVWDLQEVIEYHWLRRLLQSIVWEFASFDDVHRASEDLRSIFVDADSDDRRLVLRTRALLANTSLAAEFAEKPGEDEEYLDEYEMYGEDVPEEE